MRVKKQGFICLLLVVFIAMSGFHYEHQKESETFGSVSCEQAGFFLDGMNETNNDAGICTPKMLRVGSDAGAVHFMSRFISQRRELRASLGLLYLNLFSQEEGKFFTSSEVMQLACQYREELVTIYIHKSDGKKRI